MRTVIRLLEKIGFSTYFRGRSDQLFADLKLGLENGAEVINDAEFGYFRWQRNFYDHVIRHQPDLFRIQTYIDNNVARWKQDIENEEFVEKITGKIRRAEYADLAKI